MKLQTKIQKYLDCFTTTTRNDGTVVTIQKDLDKTPQALQNAIRAAHGDGMPNDFIYSTFVACLEKLSEYTLNTVDDIEDIRDEAVDSMVDIYTHDLTAWLASDIANVYYLTQAMDELQPDDGFKLLAAAQYIAIGEVMSEVINLLRGKK